MGADVVKAFPGEVLGPSFIKAVKGPVPNARIMPTGGVSLDNLDRWFAAGAFAVGMGGALTKPGGVSGDMELVAETARRIMDRIAEIRGGR
jgi:2-dehydro-3-deoxyphosphogluconate aldolase/(4S)-4-hydroxy-2-oxoglutarate aldolase